MQTSTVGKFSYGRKFFRQTSTVFNFEPYQGGSHFAGWFLIFKIVPMVFNFWATFGWFLIFQTGQGGSDFYQT
jgi:hypothetical protein